MPRGNKREPESGVEWTKVKKDFRRQKNHEDRLRRHALRNDLPFPTKSEMSKLRKKHPGKHISVLVKIFNGEPVTKDEPQHEFQTFSYSDFDELSEESSEGGDRVCSDDFESRSTG